MPFIRHTRDKRGYEHTLVMHAYRPGQGPARARVLYLFRTPANLKIGRRALDPEVTEALEHTHPDLSFDWTAVVREPEAPQRADGRDRDRDRWRRPGAGGPPQGQANRGRPAPPERAPIVVIREDDSLLGRTLGADHAARLRGRFTDLLQRIARRARTPEDRDRLTDRARRLNPEEWLDEAAVRAGAATVEAGWDAIATELPQRHRGRRGGRNRSGGRPAQPGDQGPGPSAIITGDGHTDGHSQNADSPGEDRTAGARGDGGGVGPDAPETAADDAPAGEHFPGGG